MLVVRPLKVVNWEMKLSKISENYFHSSINYHKSDIKAPLSILPIFTSFLRYFFDLLLIKREFSHKCFLLRRRRVSLRRF